MSDRPVVAVTRAVPDRVRLEDVAEVRVLGEEAPSREAVLEFVRGASVIVSMFSDRVDGALLDAAGPSLRGVCNYAVGYNNIDVAVCRERGVTVTNTPDAVTEGTANIAWLLIMAVARRLIAADRFARSGAWAEGGPLGMRDWLGQDLTGKTLLIVGAGRIGYATALRAKAWDMRICYVARSRHVDFEQSPLNARWVDLDEGLAEADVVSLHTPLTEHTRHLLYARRIGLLKPTAIVVNTARGPVVDEAALAEALAAENIWGAGLDVFEDEPQVHPGLVPLENVVVTPHIGSAEVRYRELMTRMVEANARAIIAGERPPNLVQG